MPLGRDKHACVAGHGPTEISSRYQYYALPRITPGRSSEIANVRVVTTSFRCFDSLEATKGAAGAGPSVNWLRLEELRFTRLTDAIASEGPVCQRLKRKFVYCG